jgi:hypothetical protein
MAYRRAFQIIKRNEYRAAAILLAAIGLANALSSSVVAYAGVFSTPPMSSAASPQFVPAGSNATSTMPPIDATPATPEATITPVTPIPAPTPIPADQPNNTAKYLVTGIVLASLAVVIGALVVMWFIVD